MNEEEARENLLEAANHYAMALPGERRAALAQLKRAALDYAWNDDVRFVPTDKAPTSKDPQ